MYVAVYNIVFAIRNESTMVNSKKIQIVYFCLTLQCMIQQSIWFDRHEVRLTYTDIKERGGGQTFSISFWMRFRQVPLCRYESKVIFDEYLKTIL